MAYESQNVAGGSSYDGPSDTPQASDHKDEFPEAEQAYENQDDEITERKLHKMRARLARIQSRSHLSRGSETKPHYDEEEISRLLLGLVGTTSFEYDLDDYVYDDAEASLDPFHSRELSLLKLQDLFQLLCEQAKDPTSWVDPRRLPSMFRFALRRPLMPERELHLHMILVGIDPSLGFLESDRHTPETPHRQGRQILKGIVFSQEERCHVSRRYERLPKGLSLLTDPIEDIDENNSADDEPTLQDEMVAELWMIFNGVEDHKIRLEDAPMKYRNILSDFDCNDEELAAWLEDFEIPSHHIKHGSDQAELSTRPVSPSFAGGSLRLERIARLVRLHRSKDIELEDFLSLIRGLMAASTLNEDMIMGYVRDSSLDAEAVADFLLIESKSTSSSANGSAIAAQEESCGSPHDTSKPDKSTLGDPIESDLREVFAAIHRAVVYSRIPFDHALSRFRGLLGDPDMSNAVLSKNLVAYGIPPDLFFGGENLGQTPPNLDGAFEEVQSTGIKKPRIILKLPAKPSSPTSPGDNNPTPATSRSGSTQSDTANHVVTQKAMPKTPHKDGNETTSRFQAATTPGAIFQSSPGNSGVVASPTGTSPDELPSQTTPAKQQPEQHRKAGSCPTVWTTPSTQGHSTGLEKSVNVQDLEPTSTLPTDAAGPRHEPEVTAFAASVEHPAFVQPLPRHRPDKSRQETRAKSESSRTRAGTPVPPRSMPLSVLRQRRQESMGIAWKQYTSCLAGNPSEVFYESPRLSISPEKGTSVDLFGLRMATKDARDMAKAMSLPPDFAEKRIRSTTARRVSAQKFEKVSSCVTLPSPKRKSSSSATPEAGRRKMRKREAEQEASESDLFAAEGQDHDDFIRSRFTPEILHMSGIACGWCLEAKCLCGKNKGDVKPAKNDRASAETAIESIERVEATSQDDCPTAKGGKASLEATADQRPSDRGEDIIPPPTPRPTSRELGPLPAAVRHTLADDVRLMSPASRASSASPEPRGLGLAHPLGLGEAAASRGLIPPTPRCTFSSIRSPLRESFMQPDSEDTAVGDRVLPSLSQWLSPSGESALVESPTQTRGIDSAVPDELMPPLSRCSFSSCRPALCESSDQAKSEYTALADQIMPSISQYPPRSPESALVESPTQTKGIDTAVPDELMPPVSPCPPRAPRPRPRELPSKVLGNSPPKDESHTEQAGSGSLHRRRASRRVSSISGTPLDPADELKAQRRQHKLFERRRKRRGETSYAQTLDLVLEEGRQEHKSYFVVMAELRRKRIQTNLKAREYRFFQTSNGLSGPSGQTVALSKLFDKYRGSRTPFKLLLLLH